jgi:hydrogenase expression/formation protein HypE
VDPLFFPGGNIGDLAVNGTVNDLLCCGADPRYISLAMILEEGFIMEDLWKIVHSIGEAARTAGVQVVTGDTKVVEKGKGDGIYINTTGIGSIRPNLHIAPDRCTPGDVVLINGSIGDHGIAILSARKGFKVSSDVQSDTCSLRAMMSDLFSQLPEIHVLRDPTRGGLASSLNEIAQSSGTGITLFESELPVHEGVEGACELMGYDPLYIANEGKILIILPEQHAKQALSIMQTHPEGTESSIIGSVSHSHPGILQLKTVIGTTRIVDTISGEQLPRIC